MVALQLDQLAMFASRAGDVDAALSMLEESYRIYRNAGIHAGVADIVAEFADVLARAGHAETAARVLSCAEAMHEEFGYFGIWSAKETESLLATIHAHVDAAAFEEAWEEGKELTSDEAVALALGAE